MTSAFASLSFSSLHPRSYLDCLLACPIIDPPLRHLLFSTSGAPRSVAFSSRRLPFTTTSFFLDPRILTPQERKKGLLFFSCLYFVNRYSLWSVTSSISDDDGAAVPCPSRHPTASWVASRPPDGSRSTSKCRSPWCWHGSTGASRCVWPRGPPSHSGWSDDGWNASWCCNDWPGGSGT